MKTLKRLLALSMALCLMATAFVGCGGTNDANTPASGSTSASGASVDNGGEKVVTLANVAAWEALHPLSSNRDNHVAFLYPIYESWVTLTNEGEIIPRLFESWEQSEEDPRILTCHLNQNATWSDGEPITAHDIVFTMELASDPDLPVGNSRQVVVNFVGTDATGIRVEGEELGVTALDDYTVQFHYKDTVAPTVLNELYCLRYTFTLPEHCLADIPVESVLTDPFWENPVTSGASNMWPATTIIWAGLRWTAW